MRDNGAVVNTSIAIATATGAVHKRDKSLLKENGGSLEQMLMKNWAKSLLYRMGFVKRRGNTKAKVSWGFQKPISLLHKGNSRDARDSSRTDYQLGSKLCQSHLGQWSKKVQSGLRDDKRQITAVFAATPVREFLPFQLIYQGKTRACLPTFKFPSDWNVTYTPNRWSNEQTMKTYIQEIIVPYVKQKRAQLKLSEDHPALAIFDVFKGQCTEEVLQMLEENNIERVCVPANCTDRLQPLDLSVNKPAKEFLRGRFQEWYASQIYSWSTGRRHTVSRHAIEYHEATWCPLAGSSLWLHLCQTYLHCKWIF